MSDLTHALTFIGGVVFGSAVTQVVMHRIWDAAMYMASVGRGEVPEKQPKCIGFSIEADDDEE